MFKPGSIRKITVRNFVTYEHAAMYPGSKLNMLIGPNGTGKSTIVAAIILGLGGNPKIVGRGSKVSEYVKHNCTNGSIIIHLQNGNNNEVLKITREFDINEKSTWKIDDRPVILKDVLHVIKQFNIQVDNLCQFLPQDRVQFFAKLNKQELLKQTQLAVCRQDLVNKQQELIDLRHKQKKIQSNLVQNNEKCQHASDTNARLESKVKNFKRKQKYLRELQNISRKIAWVNYGTAKEGFDEIKADRKMALANYEKMKSIATPLENEISEAEAVASQLNVEIRDTSNQMKNLERNINKYVENIDARKYEIGQLENDKTTHLMECEGRETDIKNSENKLNELVSVRRNLVEKKSGERSEEKITMFNSQLHRIDAEKRKLEEKKNELAYLKSNKREELLAYSNELERLENTKEQRLRHLYQISRDAHAAVLWLKSNKHLFKGTVYEPMMLEINVLNPAKAIYVENMIPLRDRIAFTCVVKEDVNTFIRLVREQLKLNVNVVHSGSNGLNMQSFQPIIPIEELRRYGMYAYVHTLFTAPEAIMNYLCYTYRLHCTPVGSAQTNSCFEQLPREVVNFFSDTYRFSISYSKYTGEKSIRQNEVKPDGTLSVSIDIVQLEMVRGRVNDSRNTCEKLDSCLVDIEAKIANSNLIYSKTVEEIKQMKNLDNEIQTLDTRIRLAENKIQNLKANISTRESIEMKYNTQIKKKVKTMIVCQKELKNAHKKYSHLVLVYDRAVASLDIAKERASFLKNKFAETKRSLQIAEELLNDLKNKYRQTAEQVKVALQRAKDLSDGFTPSDEGFACFKEAYDILPSTLEELHQEKNHVSARMECLNIADNNELQEYQDRLDLIQQLQESIQAENIELERVSQTIDKLKDEWLGPLGEIVEKINEKFGAAFEIMGCAGEVSIFSGTNENDFDGYGLSIKVTYRSGVPLQELNTVIQSGGERAVATAAFMLSLQELTPVPFRCVDEINQGMDPSNERRIFEFLVDSTSKQNSSQYFLITPKLVPNLKFADTMKIHIIFNGPFMESSEEKWENSELCKSEGCVA